MKVFTIAKGFHRLQKKNIYDGLSEKEINRLRVITLWLRTGDTELACETFGISRATLYRWVHRYDREDMSSLKDKSRRPHRVRKPQWPRELVQAVRNLRTKYPRWGKDKLAILLQQEGWGISVSTAGRILADLKNRGQIQEPAGKTISARRKTKRSHAVRKPKEYYATNPGDLVEIDTLDVRPLPSVLWKQFTARDVVSRWDVLAIRSRANAKTAREFLITLEERMPFPVKAIQVDGGSEFYAEFEDACKEKNITLYVLPPKSPKLNGHVERANRTHTEEFYEVYPTSWTIADIAGELREWEDIYNCVRPHQSLQYKTPLQFLKDCGILNRDSPSGLSHM